MLDLSAAAQHAGEQRAIANSEQVEQRMKPALSSEMASIRYVTMSIYREQYCLFDLALLQ